MEKPSYERCSASGALRRLRALADPDLAKHLLRFFKTGKGEYGEGDKFLGIKVPDLRRISREYLGLSFLDIEKLLDSREHEARFLALVILVERYKKREEDRSKIAGLYLRRMDAINNWDLVDVSCRDIVGRFAYETGDKDLLLNLARDKDLWKRRVSIVSTWWFIKQGDFNPTIEIAKLLLSDRHDLMHKAVGWMLREMGKKDTEVLRSFLQKYAAAMPRTMLRYAIEKFSDRERARWRNMKVAQPRSLAVRMFYVYILRCADGSLYTGYTNDIEKRVGKHNQGEGARYTRGRGPVKLVYSEKFDNKFAAMSREAQIKSLTKLEKEKLITIR